MSTAEIIFEFFRITIGVTRLLFRTYFIIFFLSCCSTKAASAQTAPAPSGPEIVTDRPTVTPAPFVVPTNYVQAENGLVLRKEHAGGSFNVPQTQIRLGVLPRTELRLAVPNYFLIRGGQENISAVADMSVGVKIQLGPLPGKIDLAVIPGFTMPTGSKALTTGAVDPFVQITAARRLSENWTLGSAHSIFLQTEAAETQVQGVTTNQRSVIYQPTCVLFRKLGPRADLFTEYAGNFTKGKLSDQIMDAGAVYRFRRNQQLGIRLGAGLTKASPTAFVEFGYSFLLGKIIR
ncbi:MAG: transporter [Candidatus Competibacteraceae bacterium]|nr:transporter [Candidatus Competibacteraceae bacterium]